MNIQTHIPHGKLHFNRKDLVRTISETLSIPSHYLFVPSCAYQIGNVYVNKDCSVDIQPGPEWDQVMPRLKQLGYIDSIPDSEAFQSSPEETSVHQDINIPIQNMSTAQLTNLIFLLYTRQELIQKASGTDLPVIADQAISFLKQQLPETPQAFSELMRKFESCGYLKGIRFREENIVFTLPLEANEIQSFQQLFCKMTELAQNSRCVHPVKKDIENEKYTMRNFLMALGMGGEPFKETRKVLMHRLTGFAAFKTAEQMAQHKDRYRELRHRQLEAEEVAAK